MQFNTIVGLWSLIKSITNAGNSGIYNCPKTHRTKQVVPARYKQKLEIKYKIYEWLIEFVQQQLIQCTLLCSPMLSYLDKRTL